jgi:5-methylcytosine-specific restriction endonuclease McrA
MSTVVVLNADFVPLHNVSLKHAIRMIVRQVAVVHEAEDDFMGVFPKPKVLRLIHYVVTTWRYNRSPKWTKGGVLRRDQNICAYCDSKATTIDHVLPRSRGGKNSWKNTVAACFGCNSKKDDKTPAEAGMKLLRKPFTPAWEDLRK